MDFTTSLKAIKTQISKLLFVANSNVKREALIKAAPSLIKIVDAVLLELNKLRSDLVAIVPVPKSPIFEDCKDQP